MIKGKALRRALETKDAVRITGDVPLITDTTELITPQIANEMLKNNTRNRPINWKKVEEYADIMARGEWKLHSQGIVFDENGVLLTGQKRLWAVIYSETSVYMRVSRGCPADTVRILDRGEPQSARDLAARETGRKHSPTETSIARGISVLRGVNKPSRDFLADILVEKTEILKIMLDETKGTKKTKPIMMILAAICNEHNDRDKIKNLSRNVEGIAQKLEQSLIPSTADKCWGKGVAFVLAMESAKQCVQDFS